MDLLHAYSEISVPRDPEISDHEQIHFRAKEAIERFFWIADDRFVFVERSIQHKRDARQIAEMFDQPIIPRIGFFVDGL